MDFGVRNPWVVYTEPIIIDTLGCISMDIDGDRDTCSDSVKTHRRLKHYKRVSNRNTLYNKLKKLGRKM
jgi:hypothetical protein